MFLSTCSILYFKVWLGRSRMGRLQKILGQWVLCFLVVALAIHGSRGSLSHLLHHLSRLSTVHSVSRMLLMKYGAHGGKKMFPEMFALSTYPPVEPPKIGFPSTPAQDISALCPRMKEGVPPAYLSRSQSTNAPSPLMVPEGPLQLSPTALPKSEVLPPTIRAALPPVQPSSPPGHDSPGGGSTGPAPTIPTLAGPAESPTSIHSPESPPTGGNGYGAPTAAPPKENFGHLFPVNYSQPKGSAVSPISVTSPIINWTRHGVPIPAPEQNSPIYSSPVHFLHPKGPPPLISPVIYKEKHGKPVAESPKELSSRFSSKNCSHSKDCSISSTPFSPTTNGKKRGPAFSPAPTISPSINPRYRMPVAVPPKESPNYATPVNYTPQTAPAISPSINQRFSMPAAAPIEATPSHLSPINHQRKSKGSSPMMSPVPHEAEMPSYDVRPPLSPHSQPSSGKAFHSPSPRPATFFHHWTSRRRTGNPASAPSLSHPVISPRYNTKYHAPSASVPGPSTPFHAEDSQRAPAPSQDLTVPLNHNKARGPVLSPVFPPRSISEKQFAPKLQPIHALPPPPPNLDCTSISCPEPLTNSPPGSLCACVLPISLGLRLSIALYTFFPLVSEFAKEIASGILMDQSQVRIIGANAASENTEKTIVLVVLVPLGENFEYSTAFSVYEKFWHKQVFINKSLFGDYEVLYVHYPGLPPSPPMATANINADDGMSGNGNNSRTLYPFAVDVRNQKGKQSGIAIVIVVLSAVIALVLCSGAAWLLFLKYRGHPQLPISTPKTSLPSLAKASGLATGPTMSESRLSSASASFSSSIATYAGSAKTFSLVEMERATNRFDDSRIIGEGGFGRVYEGTLDDGMRVAIKILKRDDQQGSREFLAEVEMLSRLHHRNLIKLIGICTEDHIRCLVYELVPNGSVESHLHGADREIFPLDWSARLKIALGAARGLAYLHEDSSPRVIHRDFKSSNILLEQDFTPKVSDFGLARTALGEGNELISTRVMGTFGYVAPEYAMTGHLLVKSDVYSYGVVLLELLTGRKPVDMLRPPGQENLVTWARPFLTSKDGLDAIVDPSLGTDVPFDSLAKVAAIASMCVQPEVSQRPFMGEVVQALKLVCNEGDDYKVSGSCSQGDTSAQDKEPRISTEWELESDRVLSASEIFSTPARFTRDVSGSFRRYSSSGPLRPGSKWQFWHTSRGLSTGSASEHGKPGKDLEFGEHWV